MSYRKANLSLLGDPATRGRAADGNTRAGANLICLALGCLLVGPVLVAATGCESAGRRKPVSASQIVELEDQKSELEREIKGLKQENEKLNKQVEVLLGLPEDRLQNIHRLRRVKITRYTNFYDKDDDGKKEKLVVYLQPIDEDGDIIKAPGTVDVQLWDLNKENGKALLGEWHIGQNELRKLWFKTIVTVNYRLTFDVADKVENPKDPMTVYATFTDYLTGKVFKEQKAIKPPPE